MTDGAGAGRLAAGEWPGCLTFARGVSEDQVLQAFGADPGDAVLRGPHEPVPAAGGTTDAPVIRVCRVGEWVVAVEDGNAGRH
jgi:hypothetical protein